MSVSMRETFHTLYAFLPLMPPSTSIHGDTPASSHICLSFRTFSTWYSMNFCPPKPGFTAPREELSNTIWFYSICSVSWGIIGTRQTKNQFSECSECSFGMGIPNKVVQCCSRPHQSPNLVAKSTMYACISWQKKSYLSNKLQKFLFVPTCFMCLGEKGFSKKVHIQHITGN